MPSDPPPAGGQPVVVELSTIDSRIMIIFGGALFLGLGGLAAYGAISGHIEGEDPGTERIISGCIAVFFLGFAALILASLPTAMRDRSFAIDVRGIRYQDRKRRSWACEWSEFDELRLETAERATRSGNTIPRVRLIMKPTDPGFGAKHPTMSRFAGHYGAKAGEYGMPLGPDLSIADQLDEAIRGTGARCYTGKIYTGMIYGLGGYA
ncbi:hypothetical protein GCM10011575_19290 [Microlunatus endophyticus]|uniref:Uncharacterized protein n=2 Tax=Microlunatus endophyticus TaxID=1716077 RepID=A0A917S6Q9_9ACTN|nr:hypothetical protein GCM10011575_19290 [Microlunatus endophyticus]